MPTPPTFTDGIPAVASDLQALGTEPEVFVPDLTAATSDPNLGSTGDITGLWTQNGWVIDFWWALEYGGSGVSAGSGQHRVSLPVPIAAGALTELSGGTGAAATSGASVLIACEMVDGEPDLMKFRLEDGTTVTHAAPWAWAAGDRMFGHMRYPGDF